METELNRWLTEFSSAYVESDVLLTKIQHTVSSLDTSSSKNLRVVLEGGLDDLRGGDEEGCLKWSGVAEEWAWEQLHTGHWKDTSIACRELYSLVSLLRGLAFAKMGQHEKSLEVVDKGILMGAPVLGHALQELATVLTSHISGGKKKEDSSTAIVSNAQAEQPEVSDNGKELATKDDESNQPLQVQKDGKQKAVLKKRVRFRSFVQYESDSTEPPCKRLKEASPSPEKEDAEVPYIDPDHQIKILTNPSISAFQDVMDSKAPVVLCKCTEHWPAMGTRRWSLEYIRKMAGPRTVPVELGSSYAKDDWSQKLMTISQLIDEYILNEKNGDAPKGYLAQHHLFDQVPELRRDICIPDYCCLATSEPSSPKVMDPVKDDNDYDDQDEEDVNEREVGSPLSVKINAWFGPEGTVSPLHHDPDHNLLTQVIGRKYVRLFPSSQTPYLYPHEGILSNTSQVDVESPDSHQFPLFQQASWMECILKPGEMLYIPPKCWHYVRSLDVSFSVSFWWR